MMIKCRGVCRVQWEVVGMLPLLVFSPPTEADR